MSSPRVGMVAYEFPPDVGGLGKSASRIAGLLSSRFDVQVFALSRMLAPGQVSADMDNRGFRVVRIGKPLTRTSTLALLRQIVAKEDTDRPFDLFHGLFLPAADAFLEIAHGRPTIASARGNDAVKWIAHPELKAIIHQVISRSTWITSVSSDLLARLRTVCEVPSASVIANSIQPNGDHGKWSISPGNSGCVGTVANFRSKKNIELLIRAFARIPSQLRSRLLLCGGFELEPDLESRLRVLAEDLGIENQVEFTGPVPPGSPIYDQMRRMRVFSITSDHDGMPNTLLEAADLGLPIVSTNVGGMRDIIRHGANGLLIEPNQLEELTDRLSEVLANDALAASLSAGSQGIARQLTPEVEGEAWVSLYLKLLSQESSH